MSFPNAHPLLPRMQCNYQSNNQKNKSTDIPLLTFLTQSHIISHRYYERKENYELEAFSLNYSIKF